MKTAIEIANSTISNERKQKFEKEYDSVNFVSGKEFERKKAQMLFESLAARFSKALSTDHYAMLEKAMYAYQQVAYGQMTLQDAYYKASEAL